MKYLLPLALALAGCRTPAPTPPLTIPTKSAPEPLAIAAVTPAAAPALVPPEQKKIREQAQLIEALVSQNDALSAKLSTLAAANCPDPKITSAVQAANPPPPAPEPTTRELIVPNADGVIDLAAVAAAESTREPENPFAVRQPLGETSREITLKVTGVIAGTKPCAVINERLVQPGDTIDSLVVARVDPDAVLVDRGSHRLRLPLAETRVRM